MADSFQLEVATPEKLLVQEPVREAQIPALEGMIGVLPDHAALLSLLGTGQLSFQMNSGERHTIFISGGWIQILNNHARVLADRAEPAADIDLTRAESALKRAQERLGQPSTAGVDIARALNAMKRAEARIAAAKAR